MYYVSAIAGGRPVEAARRPHGLKGEKGKRSVPVWLLGKGEIDDDDDDDDAGDLWATRGLFIS